MANNKHIDEVLTEQSENVESKRPGMRDQQEQRRGVDTAGKTENFFTRNVKLITFLICIAVIFSLVLNIGEITMGFGVWWVPYLYVWTVLWGMTMLLPKKMPNITAKRNTSLTQKICRLFSKSLEFRVKTAR